MRAVKDYEELLKLFNKHKVKYCIVGAFALAFHAQPRYTKDMDLLIEASLDNGNKIIDVLKEFGFESLRLDPQDFVDENQVVQLGFEPVRIDLLTSIEGVSFPAVWKNRVRGSYGRTKVFFIGLDDLIKNKRISSRPQDYADLKTLEIKLRKRKH